MTNTEIPIGELEEEAEPTSKTYRLDLNKGHIYGKIDGIEAVRQAIEKALLTERFYNLIYDSDYGCEVQETLRGKGVTRSYLETIIPKLIEEALSQDTRITGIYDFEIEFNENSADVKFKVDTVYGTAEIKETL